MTDTTDDTAVNPALDRALEKGMALAYLKINGAWRDHLLFGKSADT